MGRIAAHERHLVLELARKLRTLPGATVFSSPAVLSQSGVLSFTLPGWDCETLAAALSRRDIAVRAGLHCAPLAHQSAGTMETGTVRVSPSAFNTAREMERFFEVVRELSRRKNG
jgi:selenocysteine lyase/cysteine desulfurase